MIILTAAKNLDLLRRVLRESSDASHRAYAAEKPDDKLFAELRSRALPSLFNMARWKDKGHSIMGFMILARLGNLPEEEIARAATSGKWEDTLIKLEKILQPKP